MILLIAILSCFASMAKLTTHKYFTDLRMSVIVQYFCNLLAKKKEQTSYSRLTVIKLLSQIVYLTDRILLLLKNDFSKQLVDLFNLCFVAFFHWYSKLQRYFLF